ncbi:MAG: apolipoprotein N-acyltransferase [Nakamurella sp.]
MRSGTLSTTKYDRREGRWQRRWAALRGVGGLRIVAAGLGGLAVFGGFAPSTLWWLPTIGFALLSLAIRGTGWRAAAGLGVVFGCLMFLPLLSWAGIYVGATPWVALAILEAILVAPATVLMSVASRLLPLWPIWAACAWVAGETLRAVFPFGGFPWGGVAFTQANGPLLPLVAVVGESGLTFAVVLVGLGLGELLRLGGVSLRRNGLRRSSSDDASHNMYDGVRGSRWPALTVWVMIGAILVPFAGGLAALPAVQTGAGAPTAPIAVIQGNVPEPGLEFNARRRAVLDMHAAETAKLAGAIASGKVPQPRLVLWPENSSDIDPYTNADAAAVIDKAAKEVGVPILVGAVTSAGRPGYVYNKGIVWDPVTGPGQTYTKRHPVPFGEYVPWRPFFRFLSSKVDLVHADFLPGTRPGNLDINGVPIGDLICFEIVEDDLVRDVVNGGAQVLVVQTNNATFGYTNETYQQQAMSRVRAVEYGREVLIASTSGVSAVIRPNGSVETTIGLFTAGFTVPEVPLMSVTTPGTVLGAPIRWALTVVCPLLLAGAFMLSRRNKQGSGPHRPAEGNNP